MPKIKYSKIIQKTNQIIIRQLNKNKLNRYFIEKQIIHVGAKRSNFGIGWHTINL